MSSLSRPLFDSGNLHLFVQLAVEHPGALERHLPAIMACLREDVRTEQAMHALLVASQQAPVAARQTNCELISSYFSAIGRPNDGCFHEDMPDAPLPAHACAGCGTEQHRFIESPVRALDYDDGNEGEAYGYDFEEEVDTYEATRHDDVAIVSDTSPSATIPTASINTRPGSPPAALELPLTPCYVTPLLSDSDSDVDEDPATPLDLDSDLDAVSGIIFPVSPFATPLDLSGWSSRGLPPPTPSYTTMPRVMRVVDEAEEDAAYYESSVPSSPSSVASDVGQSSPSPGPVRTTFRGLRLLRHSPYLRASKDKIQLGHKHKAFERDVSPFDLDESICSYSPRAAAEVIYSPPVHAPEAFSMTRGGCDELFLDSSSSESECESDPPSSSCSSSRASSPRSRTSRSPRFDPLSRKGRVSRNSL